MKTNNLPKGHRWIPLLKYGGTFRWVDPTPLEKLDYSDHLTI